MPWVRGPWSKVDEWLCPKCDAIAGDIAALGDPSKEQCECCGYNPTTGKIEPLPN